MFNPTVSVKGAWYAIKKKAYQDDPAFEKEGLSGYCDPMLREIVLLATATHPKLKDEIEAFRQEVEKETLRHELVHAFLNECGLQNSTHAFDGPWSQNEEMVDWVAIVGPDLLRAWQEAGAL